MSFSNPIWLYGLFGLAIPVLIHLWSKKEGKTIKVGSIRFFPESETRQSRRISPNELLLLLLRCVVLAFLVMLIAQPILIGNKQKQRPTVLIDPMVVQDASVALMMDSISDGNYDIKLLQVGLPDYDPEDLNTSETISYWEAFDEIENLASDEVLIFAQNRASQLKGKVPATTKSVSWFHIPPKEPQSMVVRAAHYEDDYHVSTADFSEGSTTINNRFFSSLDQLGDLEIQRLGGSVQFKTKEQAEWLTAETLTAMNIYIRYDKGFELDAQLWTAAFKALWTTNAIATTISSGEVGIQNNTNADILVWLSESDQIDIQANTILSYKPDALAAQLIKSENDGFTITRRLSLENITSENAAEELVTTFWKDKALESLLDQFDQRTLSTDLVEPAYYPTKGSSGKQNQAMSYIYWVVLMGLIGLERVISFKRKQ